MVVTQEMIGFLLEIIAIASTFAAVVSKFNELEHRIAVNKYHIESHCQSLTHISNHLQATTGYLPITKRSID